MSDQNRLTINSVCSKEQIYPLIFYFQNGYPIENFQFDCALLQDEDGRKAVAMELNNFLYAGFEEKEFGRTFLLARNRKTGRVRLIEAGSVTLKPFNEYSIQLDSAEPDKPKHVRRKNKKKYNREKHPTNEEDARPNQTLSEPIGNEPQHQERSKLKLNGHDLSKSVSDRPKHILLDANRTNQSLPVSRESDIMPHILDKDIQTDGIDLAEASHAIDVTTELSPKYNHIMNYYHDELFEIDESNLKRKTGGHEKPRKDVDDFSAVKEMFVKGLGLGIKVGEKGRKENVHTSNNGVMQKIGNLNEVSNNEAHNDNDFSDDLKTVPLENKTYICDCCKNTFDAKGSIILHLMSYKFMRYAKKAPLRPLGKRIVGKINSGDNIHRKTVKKRNDSKSSGKNKVVKDHIFCDEEATAIHDTVKVLDHELAITNDKCHTHNNNDRQSIEIINNDSEVTDNFKDSNDDCAIHHEEDFDLKRTQVDPKRNVICDHCEKTFEDKGSLISHLLNHTFINDNVTANESMIMNKTKQDHGKILIAKANDLKLKCGSEEKVINTRTDIHEERDCTDIKIAEQAKEITTRMHLLPHTLTDERNIRQSKTTTTDNAAIREHKEIEILHYLKFNENDKKNSGADGEESNSNDSNTKQTNRILTTTMAQVKNFENNASNKQTFCDKNNATAIQNTIRIHDLVISNDSRNIQVINNEYEVTNNFKDSNEYPIHIAEDFDLTQNQNPERNVICDHCEKTFPDKGSLIFHLLAHKCITDIAAKVSIMNKTKQDLKKIEIVKANDLQLKWMTEKGITLMLPVIKLERCDSLNLFIEEHSKMTYEYCTLCEYKTPYAVRLKRHQRVHTISFKCEHCKKRFKNNSNFKIHLRTHTGDKRFQCRCGSTFPGIDTLNRHLKTHTREKSNRRHSKIHTEETHKCIACIQ